MIIAELCAKYKTAIQNPLVKFLHLVICFIFGSFPVCIVRFRLVPAVFVKFKIVKVGAALYVLLRFHKLKVVEAAPPENDKFFSVNIREYLALKMKGENKRWHGIIFGS